MPLPALVALLLLWQGAASSLDVSVVDSSNRPVPGVRLELKTGGKIVASMETGDDGHARFKALQPARYGLDASKDGFEPVQKADLELPASVELMLTPAMARKETIEVKELQPARYGLDASKDGFEPVQKADIELPAA